MTRKLTDQEFIAEFKRYNHIENMSKATGLSLRGIYMRRKRLEAKYGILLEASRPPPAPRNKAHVTKVGYRITEDVSGVVVVFGDAHIWPNERSVAFDALIKLIPRLNPKMVICDGDSFDGARISRHAPGGWANLPDVADELAAVQEHHAEIEAVAPAECKLIWTLGNHDSRFTSKLAQHAPDYVRVHGMDITDHFPAWNFAWSVWLNGHTVIKHRHHQGIHAAFQNVLKGGKNIATGHTHRLQAVMFSDYNGLRWGIECGTVSEYGTESDKFAYAEDNPMNHCQGFMVLTFDKAGMLLEPEPCRVINGKAYFRGEVVQ